MKSVCFTGHRILPKDSEKLKQKLYAELEKAVISGAIHFYSGGAVGWDTLAAWTVLQLRKVYPNIRLHLILPCAPQEQSIKWTQDQRQIFAQIQAAADTVEQTAEHYYTGCMRLRNARLVSLADGCFCYYNPLQSRSGTGQTVRMAVKRNLPVLNFFLDGKD